MIVYWNSVNQALITIAVTTGTIIRIHREYNIEKSTFTLCLLGQKIEVFETIQHLYSIKESRQNNNNGLIGFQTYFYIERCQWPHGLVHASIIHIVN